MKALKLIKKAKALYGSFSELVRAINKGTARQDLGPEALNILAQLTGVDGIITGCFT
ncbi:hypothetical protein [Actinopolyspora mortivallis]|uniref:hypothetical protein n=1 Tax=Actinopolyspora mortivallis TaxID=33906 RepID=UPI0012EE2562|nr:hypothetical protein [Actinopolyspora mortivallis]